MYNKLVLSGGSMKGLAYIGFIEYLQEKGIVLDTLNEFVGTSIGAFSAMLLVLGYTSSDLKDIFLSFDFEKIKDFKVGSLVSTYGLDDGSRMNAMIKVFIKNKNFSEDITLKELFQKTKKSLVTVATNINSRETVFFNKEKYPNLPVYLAVRMSLNIPFVFAPVLFDGHYYADGGLTCNFPTKYYTDDPSHSKRVLCLSLSDHDPTKPDIITELDEYIYSVLKSAFYSIECSDKNYAARKNYSVVCIQIKDVSGLDFNLSKEQREIMYAAGYHAARQFFESKNSERSESERTEKNERAERESERAERSESESAAQSSL